MCSQINSNFTSHIATKDHQPAEHAAFKLIVFSYIVVGMRVYLWTRRMVGWVPRPCVFGALWVGIHSGFDTHNDKWQTTPFYRLCSVQVTSRSHVTSIASSAFATNILGSVHSWLLLLTLAVSTGEGMSLLAWQSSCQAEWNVYLFSIMHQSFIFLIFAHPCLYIINIYIHPFFYIFYSYFF